MGQTRYTLSALLNTSFPDPVWAVDDVIPVGLTDLAGRPKIGKSWLALQIAGAVSSGGSVLGRQVQQGRVLFIALEDSPRRLQDRLKAQGISPSAELEFAFEWPRLDVGGIGALAAELAAVRYRLVVIDTLSRALGRLDQNDIGKMSDTIGRLQETALSNNTALLGLDHHRKTGAFDSDPLDDVLGSTGKTAPLDCALGLYRDRAGGFVLKGRGRDMPEVDLALAWDPVSCTWQSNGSAAQFAMAGNRSKILAALRAAVPDALTASDVASETGIDRKNTTTILNDLCDSGAVRKLPKVGRNVPYVLV